ncbi:MAG: DUF362 domain-containing protein [Candidatus Firestonebacteria bacterium]
MKSKVAIKYCDTYDLDKLENVFKEILILLYGESIPFKKGEKVLLKPNLLTDAAPEYAITTHPIFVQAVVRVFKNMGLKIAIADIPAGHRLEKNLDKVYSITGMADVAKKENVHLLTETKFVQEDGIIFSSWMKEFDHIVSLPKLKTHSQMILTGAVKNMFGLIPRLYRVNLHRDFIKPDDFAVLLLEIYKKCKPTISFVDGIIALEGNGPAHNGIPKNIGLIAASSDALALDSILAKIIGLNPEDISTNKIGKLKNLGITDLKNIEIKGDKIEKFLGADFKLPPKYILKNAPELLLKILKKSAEFRPKVDKTKCTACRICVENCPLAAIDIKNKIANINYKKCIDCFCCLEVCPIGAMKTKSGPLIYVLKYISHLKTLVIRLKNRKKSLLDKVKTAEE